MVPRTCEGFNDFAGLRWGHCTPGHDAPRLTGKAEQGDHFPIRKKSKFRPSRIFGRPQRTRTTP